MAEQVDSIEDHDSAAAASNSALGLFAYFSK